MTDSSPHSSAFKASENSVISYWTKINNQSSLVPVIGLLVLSVFIIVFRAHTYSEPLERDITTHAIIGHGLLSGLPLYSVLWDHKPPAVYITHAIGELIFGFGNNAIYGINVVASIITLIAVYFAGRRYSGGPFTGLAAGAFWVLLSQSLVLEANQPNSEVFINSCLSVIFAILINNKRLDNKTVLFTGLLTTWATLYKQIAFVPVCFLLITRIILSDSQNRKKYFVEAISITLIAVLIWFLVATWFLETGSFPDFYQAVFAYNIGYYSHVGMSDQLITYWECPKIGLALDPYVQGILTVAATVGIATIIRTVSFSKLSLPFYKAWSYFGQHGVSDKLKTVWRRLTKKELSLDSYAQGILTRAKKICTAAFSKIWLYCSQHGISDQLKTYRNYLTKGISTVVTTLAKIIPLDSFSKLWLYWLVYLFGILVAIILPHHPFPHYFQLVLPLTAIGGAWGLVSLQNSFLIGLETLFSRYKQSLTAFPCICLQICLALMFFGPLFTERIKMLCLPPNDWSFAKYTQWFIADKIMGEKLKPLLLPQETIYVWGDASTLYFYSGHFPIESMFFSLFCNDALMQQDLSVKWSTRVVLELSTKHPDMIIVPYYTDRFLADQVKSEQDRKSTMSGNIVTSWIEHNYHFYKIVEIEDTYVGFNRFFALFVLPNSGISARLCPAPIPAAAAIPAPAAAPAPALAPAPAPTAAPAPSKK